MSLHDAVRELVHVAAGHKNLTQDEANDLLAAVDADEAPAAEPEPEAPAADEAAPAEEAAPVGGDEATGFAAGGN